jgi:small subunit ribosomal protein S6
VLLLLLINPCSRKGAASPKGGENMPLYEVMFIVEPTLEGEELEKAIEKVENLMVKNGGEIINLKKIGKKRLAYEIKDFRDGFYVLINVQAERKMVGELDHFFKVNEGYLRHIVFRMEENEDKVEKKKVKETVEIDETNDELQDDKKE